MDYVLDCHEQYLEGNQNVDYIKQVANVINTSAPAFYVEAILKTWFIQCIASWDFERTTPCVGAKEKYESVLVIQGGQGVQKTKFFSALLPSKQQHYIKTGAMLNPSDKDSLMQNTAYGINELGELDSTFNKSDIGALKAFLSNSIDEYRAPYGKTASKHKRCTSFCGSVNESGFLRDPTGARRFWVIPANAINFKSFEMIDKDMLWAQVYDLYINGEKWWFDETDTEINAEIQNLHNLQRAYSLADEVFTQVKHSTAPKQWLSVTKIYQNYSDERASRKDGSDLTSLLEHAGFSKNARKEFLVPCAPVPASASTSFANNFEFSNSFKTA
jgi:predicted P-loop ATPase